MPYKLPPVGVLHVLQHGDFLARDEAHARQHCPLKATLVQLCRVCRGANKSSICRCCCSYLWHAHSISKPCSSNHQQLKLFVSLTACSKEAAAYTSTWPLQGNI